MPTAGRWNCSLSLIWIRRRTCGRATCPTGQQRKLEIARALATNPKLLCLDEPAAGMNNTETRELMETIAFIRQKFGISILLIEHDMPLVWVSASGSWCWITAR